MFLNNQKAEVFDSCRTDNLKQLNDSNNKNFIIFNEPSPLSASAQILAKINTLFFNVAGSLMIVGGTSNKTISLIISILFIFIILFSIQALFENVYNPLIIKKGYRPIVSNFLVGIGMMILGWSSVVGLIEPNMEVLVLFGVVNSLYLRISQYLEDKPV